MELDFQLPILEIVGNCIWHSPKNLMGIKASKGIVEKDVENAIISNLQKFLLGMGRGFCFVGSQMTIQLLALFFAQIKMKRW